MPGSLVCFRVCFPAGFISTFRLIFSMPSVPERRLCGAPLHASVRTPSQAQEVPLRSHGPEERLIRPLSQVRLPVQAHPPEEDHVGAAAGPAVHAQPQARARPKPARVRQGPRWSGTERRRRSWGRRQRTGHVGSGLHDSGRHNSLRGKRRKA